MNFQLVQVQGSQIHQWWDLVEADIEECRVNDPDDAWLQDIYCAIKLGQAALYVGQNDHGYVGMCVCNLLTDSFSGRIRFNIWYLNCKEGWDFIKLALPQLEDIARKAGAEQITFSATREVFERWAKPLGFELREIRLFKELY